MFIFNISDFKH